ncbi:RHS repeat-associated protein [Xanthomonas sacchari]|uniref:RHS repeat-associated core domain-containing protein n=1 Tax=unclassified Xanthomonas TaxID=2643310 RepID=UPI0017AF87A6|nr:MULTISPECIES: RHS repeat-associated core domain-containing protein [unclassified Xanthomonas]MBB6368417.1 RHS repeat-associated protein [Xanthomonas sp. F10]
MSNFQGICAVMRLMAATALLLFVAFGASAQTVRYIHTDGLGSVVLVTDKDRNVLERREYEPYGSTVNQPVTDGPGYTGHVMDAATGLTYMQQRYYDPVIGRFLSVDPITTNASAGANFNRYKYAANNPYFFTDPDGRCEKVTGSNICGGGSANAMMATSAGGQADASTNKNPAKSAPQSTQESKKAEAARMQQVGEVTVTALAALAMEITEMFPDGGSSDFNAMASVFFVKTEVSDFDSLVAAGNKPINPSGLSAAARAWDKHAGRPGGSFPVLRGGVEQKNLAAENFIRAALNGTRTELSGGGFEYRTSTGQGVRFNQDGSLSGFLDPKRK